MLTQIPLKHLKYFPIFKSFQKSSLGCLWLKKGYTLRIPAFGCNVDKCECHFGGTENVYVKAEPC